MANESFENIKCKIINWYQHKRPALVATGKYFEMTKNEKDIVIIDMTFDNCLAQISVSDPLFAPYRHVSFEAVTANSKRALDSGQAELVYFFYDSVDMSDNEVIGELSLAVDFCSEYVPDKLEEEFAGKYGVINVGNETLSYVIHPDDIEKISASTFDCRLICTGTQFQYLVVDNGMVKLRVLPKAFETITS